MVNIRSRNILALLFLVCRVTASSGAPPSPSANTGLVCSTTDTADCYPRLFEPTADFKIIKEGQDIPPGLHVRMNIYTGEREARLNIPMEGDDSTNPIPTEQAMLIVKQPEVEQIIEEQAALRDSFPEQPPAFDAAGKIPPPPPSDGDEFGTFHQAMAIIPFEGREFDKALSDLRELSHDIYYGVEIAKHGPVLEKLACQTLGRGSEKFPADKEKRDQQAASILASSIQNNPTALKELGANWKLIMYPLCGTDAKSGNFVSILRSRLGREKDPQTLKSKITAISGLLREPSFRADFLNNGGMELMLAMWLKKGEQWDVVKQKVAQLVMDNFLDEGMGAVLGIWPKRAVEGRSVCETKGQMLGDGCWEHHVERFLEGKPETEWASELLKTLGEQRPKSAAKAAKKDREL